MRKGIVIVGAVLLVIGVASAGGGGYLAVGSSNLGSAVLPSQKTTVALAPGANVTVGATDAGKVTIIAYTDNASAPLEVSAGGATALSRTSGSGGSTTYFAVVTGGGSAPHPIALVNNQTKSVSVQYGAGQSSIGALASAGLLILGGAALAIIGVIVLVVGVILKKQQPQAPPAP